MHRRFRREEILVYEKYRICVKQTKSPEYKWEPLENSVYKEILIIHLWTVFKEIKTLHRRNGSVFFQIIFYNC